MLRRSTGSVLILWRGERSLAISIPSFNFFEETLMFDALVLVESGQLLHYCVWENRGVLLGWLRVARSAEAA